MLKTFLSPVLLNKLQDLLTYQITYQESVILSPLHQLVPTILYRYVKRMVRLPRLEQDIGVRQHLWAYQHFKKLKRRLHRRSTLRQDEDILSVSRILLEVPVKLPSPRYDKLK